MIRTLGWLALSLLLAGCSDLGGSDVLGDEDFDWDDWYGEADPGCGTDSGYQDDRYSFTVSCQGPLTDHEFVAEDACGPEHTFAQVLLMTTEGEDEVDLRGHVKVEVDGQIVMDVEVVGDTYGQEFAQDTSPSPAIRVSWTIDSAGASDSVSLVTRCLPD